MQLLSKNPAKRLGGSIENLKANSWFAGFDWAKLLSKQLTAPYIPTVKKYSGIQQITINNASIDDVISPLEEVEEVPLRRKKSMHVAEDWDKEF